MEEGIHEECGVLGLYLKECSRDSDTIVRNAHISLSAMQHRGQTGAGFVVYNMRDSKYGKILKSYKGAGTVYQLFGGGDNSKTERIYSDHSGIALIGHVRYGTSGYRGDDEDYVQPFYRRHGRRWKRFALSFNGNLANYSELEEDLIGTEYDLETSVDTELIMHLFSLGLNRLSDKTEDSPKKPDFFKLAEYSMSKMDGAYNIVLLFGDGDLAYIRDPNGFRPLVYGENEEISAIASERIALERMGIKREHIQIIPPGSAGVINRNGRKNEVLFPNKRKSHCHFEGIYFSSVASDFEGKPIHFIRTGLGRELARSETPDILELIDKNRSRCVVVDAPDTAFEAASQYAIELGIPLRRGLIKISAPDEPRRGFINEPSQRSRIIKQRYQEIPEVFDDRIVFLIEDSIVRAETLRNLIGLIKSRTRVDQIHVRVTDPPVTNPCFYGIDMSSFGEFIFNKFPDAKGIDEHEKFIADYLGVNSFRYQTDYGLENAFGVEFNGKLCKACLGGNYPTEFGEKRVKEAMEDWKKKISK